jgi:hypothetical protein
MKFITRPEMARERFCDMDAQPGRLAHLRDDDILDRFSYQRDHMEIDFSPHPFGLSLESEPLCVGKLSTQSNSQSKRKFSHGLII